MFRTTFCEIGAVEGGVVQGRSRALPLWIVTQSAMPLAAFSASAVSLRRQVNTDLRGDPARWPADAAPNVEDALPGLRIKQPAAIRRSRRRRGRETDRAAPMLPASPAPPSRWPRATPPRRAQRYRARRNARQRSELRCVKVPAHERLRVRTPGRVQRDALRLQSC